jgi:hypothetical protein
MYYLYSKKAIVAGRSLYDRNIRDTMLFYEVTDKSTLQNNRLYEPSWFTLWTELLQKTYTPRYQNDAATFLDHNWGEHSHRHLPLVWICGQFQFVKFDDPTAIYECRPQRANVQITHRLSPQRSLKAHYPAFVILQQLYNTYPAQQELVEEPQDNSSA